MFWHLQKKGSVFLQETGPFQATAATHGGLLGDPVTNVSKKLKNCLKATKLWKGRKPREQGELRRPLGGLHNPGRPLITLENHAKVLKRTFKCL